MEMPERFDIIVKTNSPKTLLRRFDEDKKAYIVEVKAQPEKGKANIEIIKFFSRLLKKKVRIISGLASKRKTITAI